MIVILGVKIFFGNKLITYSGVTLRFSILRDIKGTFPVCRIRKCLLLSTHIL